jgi:tRNA (guanine37-N1)-methyltransferase
MKITILTLFPEMFSGFITESIIGRAIKDGKVEVEIVNLRNWGLGKHQQVDDTPYGGGAGMVLRPDVVVTAIRDVSTNQQKTNNKQIQNSKYKILNTRVILLTPQGKTFNQARAKALADDLVYGKCDLLLVCGHYEGFDERIRDYVDEEISIGDYVLTGGELAAGVITDAVVRLLPGVLGNEESHQKESFSLTQNPKLKTQKLLEHAHYTKPEDFEGKKVPEVLLSGHHANIEKWRQEQSVKRTQKRRPDLS